MFVDLKENKTLKYLTLGLIIISLIILLKEVILKPKPLSLPESPYSFHKINIDFSLLEDKEIEKLLPYEEITALEKLGREDPFEPY